MRYKHWLRRAYRRGLLSKEQVGQLKPVIDELTPRLNAYLKAIGRMIRSKKSNHEP